MGVSEELVRIPGDPAVFGIYRPPEAAPARAAVLWLHGWSGNRQGPNRLLVELARGIPEAASLRIDLPGHGETPAGPAGVTIDAMIEAAVRAGAFLRSRAGVPRLVLGGICSGGNVAMGASTLAPADALVLLSTPPFREQRLRGSAFRRRFRVLASLAGRFLRGGWRRFLRGESNLRAAARYVKGDSPSPGDPRDSVRNIPRDLSAYRGPVLLAYGDRDTESENGPSAFESLFRENGGPVGRITLEGANHNFYGSAWRDRLREEIRDWLSDAGSRPKS